MIGLIGIALLQLYLAFGCILATGILSSVIIHEVTEVGWYDETTFENVKSIGILILFWIVIALCWLFMTMSREESFQVLKEFNPIGRKFTDRM